MTTSDHDDAVCEVPQMPAVVAGLPSLQRRQMRQAASRLIRVLAVESNLQHDAGWAGSVYPDGQRTVCDGAPS